MRAVLKIDTEVDIKFVDIAVPVRYDEEDIPNDFPLRNGNCWEARVDIDTGEILSWPKGRAERLAMKVCDGGDYVLRTATGTEILAIRGNYIPNDLIPGEFGDYIDLDINEDGRITNWPTTPSIAAFIEDAK